MEPRWSVRAMFKGYARSTSAVMYDIALNLIALSNKTTVNLCPNNAQRPAGRRPHLVRRDAGLDAANVTGAVGT